MSILYISNIIFLYKQLQHLMQAMHTSAIDLMPLQMEELLRSVLEVLVSPEDLLLQ